MNNPVERKLDVVSKYLRREISIKKGCVLLQCDPRTFFNYRVQFLQNGVDGLKDRRGGNNRKLTDTDKQAIVSLKDKDRWRSARNIKDNLKLTIHKETVRRILKIAGLAKVNIERVKPIHTFEAAHPNEMWQTDIMGKNSVPPYW
ncbi:MAG: helix-turn-helix domain-containing protein [Patescibacteria group bacterium]